MYLSRKCNNQSYRIGSLKIHISWIHDHAPQLGLEYKCYDVKMLVVRLCAEKKEFCFFRLMEMTLFQFRKAIFGYN